MTGKLLRADYVIWDISIKSISNWNTPGNLTVNVSRDKTSEATVVYTPLKYGFLTVTITPQEVVDLGGQKKTIPRPRRTRSRRGGRRRR